MLWVFVDDRRWPTLSAVIRLPEEHVLLHRVLFKFGLTLHRNRIDWAIRRIARTGK